MAGVMLPWWRAANSRLFRERERVVGGGQQPE
jgi:hypothetical protein